MDGQIRLMVEKKSVEVKYGWNDHIKPRQGKVELQTNLNSCLYFYSFININNRLNHCIIFLLDIFIV